MRHCQGGYNSSLLLVQLRLNKFLVLLFFISCPRKQFKFLYLLPVSFAL